MGAEERWRRRAVRRRCAVARRGIGHAERRLRGWPRGEDDGSDDGCRMKRQARKIPRALPSARFPDAFCRIYVGEARDTSALFFSKSIVVRTRAAVSCGL